MDHDSIYIMLDIKLNPLPDDKILGLPKLKAFLHETNQMLLKT